MKDDQKLWDYYQTENKENFLMSSTRLDYVFSLVKKNIKKSDAKIADMGYGDGYLLDKLSGYYTKLFGMDISEKNIEQSLKKHENIDFILNKEDSIKMNSQSLDGLIASEVLEHIDDKNLFKIVSEANRVLKNNGLFFVTFPARENLSDNHCYCPNCGHDFHKWGHKQVWDKDKIKSVFENDFEIVTLSEKIFPSPNQNVIGKTVSLLRKTALSFGRKMSGSTFVLVLKKK